MSRFSIITRLVAVVGQTEAIDLLETPAGHLGGRTPMDLLNCGDFGPVEALVKNLELARREPLAVEDARRDREPPEKRRTAPSPKDAARFDNRPQDAATADRLQAVISDQQKEGGQ